MTSRLIAIATALALGAVAAPLARQKPGEGVGTDYRTAVVPMPEL